MYLAQEAKSAANNPARWCNHRLTQARLLASRKRSRSTVSRKVIAQDSQRYSNSPRTAPSAKQRRVLASALLSSSVVWHSDNLRSAKKRGERASKREQARIYQARIASRSTVSSEREAKIIKLKIFWPGFKSTSAGVSVAD